MARRYTPLLCLVVFSLTLLACSLLSPEQPLPTVAPTAESIPPQGNLGQGITAITALPTQPVPTASPTSPPTPTEDLSALAQEPVTADAGAVVSRATGTADSRLTPEPPSAEQILPTTTPTLTPSLMPSSTSTNEPDATSTPTPVLMPRLPDIIWPSPVPYDQPLSNSPRHGVATALGGGAEGVYGRGPYSWTSGYTSYVPPVARSVQHVPMLAGNTRNGLPPLDEIMLGDSYNDHNYWLVFNECEHTLQCNASPAEAAQFFHDQVVDLLYVQGGDPDADLIVGGVNAHPCGILWLKNFVDYYRVTYGPLPHTGWHFHLYPEIAPSHWPDSCEGGWAYNDFLFPDVDTAFNLWRDHAYNALAFVQEYGEADDEIWFTEMGCLNYGFHQVQAPVCQAEGFVQGYAGRILDWLNTEGRWVTRYAWYTNWDTGYWRVTHLIWEAPAGQQWTYSSLGYWYSQIVPASAVPLPGFDE